MSRGTIPAVLGPLVAALFGLLGVVGAAPTGSTPVPNRSEPAPSSRLPNRPNAVPSGWG